MLQLLVYCSACDGQTIRFQGENRQYIYGYYFYVLFTVRSVSTRLQLRVLNHKCIQELLSFSVTNYMRRVDSLRQCLRARMLQENYIFANI